MHQFFIHTVGIIACLANATFVQAHPIQHEKLSLYWTELRDMCQCCMLLFQVPRSALDSHYHNLIRSSSDELHYLPHLEHNMRRFGCINPAYRKRPELKHRLQCDPLVLALCDFVTGSNFNPVACSIDFAVPLYDKPSSRTLDKDSSNQTHPVRYYCVPLAMNGQPVDNWQRRQSNNGINDRSRYNLIEQPFSAVVFGRNNCQ